MPASTRDVSRDAIVPEINKAFERIKRLINPTIADLLKVMNLKSLCHNEYREIDFPYESLCKALLLKKLKGIRFQTELVRYLKTHKRERKKLGLKRTPDQTTISYFITNVLDEETKHRIDSIAEVIEHLAPTYGILLDVKIITPEKPKKETKVRNQFLQKRDKTSEVCKLFKKQIMPFVDLKLKHNALYKKNQFINLLIHNGLTKDFAENGSKTIQAELSYKRMFCPKCHTLIYPTTTLYENGNEATIFKCEPCGFEKRISPDADTLLYHMKQYKTYDEIHKMFTIASEKIWEMARKTNQFNLRNKYDVAIDLTDWLFYGDRNTPMIMGREPKDGTWKCYRFATIDIVEDGRRFTLLTLPVEPFTTKTEILKKLLSYALERIRISNVYVDRGFCDSNSIKIFNSFRLKFLMPCTQYSTVKKIIDIVPLPYSVRNFQIKDVTINLIILQEPDNKGGFTRHAYATNELFEIKNEQQEKLISDLYSNRWGIETGYRVKKHSFRSKTTSKNYQIRLFYIMFSVLLYNLWILADILIWLALFGYVKEGHLVTSKYFGTVLYIVDDPGG